MKTKNDIENRCARAKTHISTMITDNNLIGIGILPPYLLVSFELLFGVSMERDLAELSPTRVPFMELQCYPPHAVLSNARNQRRALEHYAELRRVRNAEELRRTERSVAEWNEERLRVRFSASTDYPSYQSESSTDSTSSPDIVPDNLTTCTGTQMRNRLLGVPGIDDSTVNDIMDTFESLGLLIQHLSLLSVAELSRLRPAWRHLHHHYGPYW